MSPERVDLNACVLVRALPEAAASAYRSDRLSGAPNDP